MSKVTFDEDKLNEFTAKYQAFENSFNNLYSSLADTAEQLMGYGWKGSASKPFYNNLSNYFTQMDGSKNAIVSQLSTLGAVGTAAASQVEEAARGTM